MYYELGLTNTDNNLVKYVRLLFSFYEVVFNIFNIINVFLLMLLFFFMELLQHVYMLELTI